MPPCRPVPELAAFVARIEAAGFSSVWVPDSQLLWRDPFATLIAAAQTTSTIQLGTAVSNVQTRLPSVVASAVRTAAEIAPGRVVAGVGAGNSAVEPVGLRPSTGAALRDGVTELRQLLDGEGVRYVPDREQYLEDPPSQRVPLYVAATGPKNLGVAGAIADGAIVLGGLTSTLLPDAIDKVHAGARDAGRDPSEVAIVSTGFCHVTEDPERDARMLKPIITGMSVTGGKRALDRLGVQVEVPAVLPPVRPDLIHARDWDEAMAACDPYVSDEDALIFARNFCLFGDRDHVRRGLEELHTIGVTDVFVQHVGSYTLPEHLLEDVGGLLTPAAA
ncbi:LLM class flavin-dependent oxidoreductase [Nitriliruptoraceae bacterium ZYF776]|nr:LLM class flavin-dependent oxidoreductase [Profundirhabdus halotolerans]